MSDFEATLAAAAAFGVIPVVEVETEDAGEALAETLLQAGLGVIEVTFRTPDAAAVIARIARRCPAMLVGAGTVITAQDLDRAADAGARFALAPGLSVRQLERAAALGLPYIPGAMTPSELQTGIEHGVGAFKLFPAMQAGGIGFLRAIAAPFALHALRFIPTGGVSSETMSEWLREPSVSAVGGTWIATRSMIQDADWGAIRGRAEHAVRLARDLRETA